MSNETTTTTEPTAPAAKGKKPAAKGKPAKGKAKAKAKAKAPAKGKKPAQRTGTKQEALIAMLRTAKGGSIAEIAKRFGWQAHTVRGAIAGGLKKKLGLKVEAERVEGRGTVYRIA